METREKLRFSSSALYTYDDCEFKFKLAYVDKVRPSIMGSIYSVFGTAIHKTIEDFYSGGKFDDVSSITSTWPDRLASEVAAKLPLFTKEALDPFRELGFDILDTFYLRQKEDGCLVVPKHTEKKMVHETPNYVVVGIMDVAFNLKDGFEIVDYKTSSKAKTKKELAVDHQLTMYAWLYWKTFGEIPTRLGLHYLKMNKKLYTTRTLEDLEAFSKRIEDLYQTILTKETWKPNFSHCHWCDYRNTCPQNETQKIRLV